MNPWEFLFHLTEDLHKVGVVDQDVDGLDGPVRVTECTGGGGGGGVIDSVQHTSSWLNLR